MLDIKRHAVLLPAPHCVNHSIYNYLVLVLDPAVIEENEPLPLESVDLLETLIPEDRSHLTLRFLNVNKQSGSDSAILVIALALDICFRPKNIFNEYTNIRGHLFASLQNDSIDLFESESENIVSKITNVITIDKVC